MNSLAISIIVWNNADDAIECANSLLAQTVADRLTILFVDNDSDESTVEQLEAYISSLSRDNVSMIHTGYNGGTAGGFTAATKWAESQGVKYIGALNADAVADSKWVESLLAELEQNPDAGIAAGVVLDREGQSIDSTGEFYALWGIPGPRGRDKPTSETPAESEYIFGATGGAYLCRTSMYKIVGYYDEKMFMYYEDIDFSFRAQLYGYKVRYSPSAVVYHKRGASSGTVPGLAVYNTFKNLPLVYLKNVPKELLGTIGIRFFTAYKLILLNAIARGNGVPALKGWFASVRLLGYALKQRKMIQSHNTVNAAYISSIIVHDIPPEQTGLRKFRSLITLGRL